MSGSSVRSTILRTLAEPRAPRTISTRLIVVGAVMLPAMLISLLTGGGWTPVVVGIASLVSLLAVLPRVSWLAQPVGAYAGLWLGFNVLRAGADDTAWSDHVLALVPRAEAWLVGGRLPSARLQAWFHRAGDLGWHDYALGVIYLSFFVAPYVVAGLLIWRDLQLCWRYVIATAILFGIATACFYVLPTAPPWLVEDLRSRADFAAVTRITEPVIASFDLPVGLFRESARNGARTSEVHMEPNPVAAMPSIHFAATALIAGPARSAGPAVFATALVYAALMGIALVYLGEHYVLDLAAGGAITAAAWAVAGRWLDAAGIAEAQGHP